MCQPTEVESSLHGSLDKDFHAGLAQPKQRSEGDRERVGRKWERAFQGVEGRWRAILEWVNGEAHHPRGGWNGLVERGSRSRRCSWDLAICQITSLIPR